jgi:hypothetical protein
MDPGRAPRKKRPASKARSSADAVSRRPGAPDEFSIETILEERPKTRVVREFFAAQAEAVNERAAREDEWHL